MISQANQRRGGVAELPNEASSANHANHQEIRVDQSLRQVLMLDRTAIGKAPKSIRVAAERELEAHVERRKRLAARIRVENPALTEEEIEERLERFGV